MLSSSSIGNSLQCQACVVADRAPTFLLVKHFLMLSSPRSMYHTRLLCGSDASRSYGACRGLVFLMSQNGIPHAHTGNSPLSRTRPRPPLRNRQLKAPPRAGLGAAAHKLRGGACRHHRVVHRQRGLVAPRQGGDRGQVRGAGSVGESVPRITSGMLV